MKKTLLFIACCCVISLSSCKKDRDCECIETITNPDGHSTTTQPEKITYIKMSNGEAKSICQKSTVTETLTNGKTRTTINDCKLK